MVCYSFYLLHTYSANASRINAKGEIESTDWTQYHYSLPEEEHQEGKKNGIDAKSH